jgi:exodeoxyribonuclease VII large subunit
MPGDFTVLELNRAAGEILSMAFPEPVWVRGVVALPKRGAGPSGHLYFQLADPSPEGGQTPAAADCALFAGDRIRITRELGRQGVVLDIRDGMEARFQVVPSIYEKNGRYSYIVRGFDPEFTGTASMLHLKRLVEKLRSEGVLQRNGALPFPVLPLGIGLVTARGSAACEDFLQTLRESGYPFEVFAAWAPMQGSDTGRGVCRALDALVGIPGIDAAVVTRGGGSATDLAWFNDETIARVIAGMPFPVISGIGHETDMTLPDFAAHTRAKTPTHAAGILVDRVASFSDSLAEAAVELHRAAAPRISLERMVLSRLGESLGERTARVGLRGLSSLSRAMGLLHGRALPGIAGGLGSVGRLAARLPGIASGIVARNEALLDRLEACVAGRDPDRMLALGWALALDAEGKPIKSVAAVKEGDGIMVRLSDGRMAARVEGVEPD